MLKWITSNPIVAGLIGLAIVVFILAGFSFLSRENKREEERVFNSGVVVERDRTKGEVINAVQNANRPVTSDERNSVCSKYDRNCPERP